MTPSGRCCSSGVNGVTAVSLCALLAWFIVAEAIGSEHYATASFLVPEAASGAPLPVADFTEVKSATTERDGSIELAVAFTHAFLGRLNYCVDDSAEQGTDYVSVRECRSREVGSATGEATGETSIVIDLREDVRAEEVETIRVTLRSGDGYQVGVRDEHVVSVGDNDFNWRVMHDVDGMRFDYGIQFLRKGDSTTAAAWSDGLSGLPAGNYPVKLTATDDLFEAIVGPITIAADQTLLGAELSRTFRLVANRPEDGPPINYGQPLFGTVTETWASPKGAAYLSRRNPIHGTFLMSRTVSDMVPADFRMEKASTQTTTSSTMVDLVSECEIDDLWTTNRFTVKPSIVPGFPNRSRDNLADRIDVSQISGSFGQPFAPSIPFPNFVDETLRRARSDLYYDMAATQAEKDAAAFRYQVLLYKKEDEDAETYIRAQFDEIDDHWDCAARRRALTAAQSLVGALRYAPWNRELRWALLDIYHDIAVADKAVARQRHAAVAEAMLKEELAPGESLIHQEISDLEQALVLYRYALAGYMQVLHRTFGVDVADFESDPELQNASLGYHMFRAEVPFRSPLSASLGKGVDETHSDPLVAGYKDATLLFELLREYLQGAAQLSKRYMLRNNRSDPKRAERLIGNALLTTWLEGNALLAIFPELGEPGAAIGPFSSAREAVAGWRQSYSALGQVRNFLRGDANILGFTDDTLVLTQSTIPGDDTTRFFQTYDFLSTYMLGAHGPLKRAIEDLEKARQDYKDYRHRSDELAQQLNARNEQYDSRLREIVGARPSEKTRYDRPADNEGGLIRQRFLSIKAARLRIERNRQRIENIEEAVRLEVWRRGQEKGFNDAISNVYVDFGSRQVELTRQIAQIREDQMNSSNEASVIGSWLGAAAGILLAPATGGASLMLTAGSAASFISGGINASEQAGTEIEKGEKQALKEQYAAQERAKIHALQDDLLDANSKARVKTLLLDMSVLALDSREATIALKLEMEQLAALYLEKEDLERRRTESHELLAARYFADPSHRLLKNASLLRSEYSFAEAQRWMFLTIRAAEYKWNQIFVHETDEGRFSIRSLFIARNADELKRLFNALAGWEKRHSVSGRNDNGYKKLSLREDFLGFKDGNTYSGPDGRPTDSEVAFQQFISRTENYLGPEDPENPIPGFKVLRLRFSTAYVPDSGGLFLRNRWLEKINFLRVRLLGGVVRGINSTVDGYLSYGGLSLVRNQSPGSQRPGNPTRWTDESTAYSTRYWYFRDGRWNPKETFGAPISVQVSKDVDVPLDVYQIDAFREYSVATSEWTLYVAVEKEGHKLVELENLTDIEFHIHFFWYVRN